MIIAEQVKNESKGFTGDARLYKLSEPVFYSDIHGKKKPTNYSIVSATMAYGLPETYIFPAEEHGEVLDWGELEGSFQGGLDHEKALEGAGIVLIPVFGEKELADE